MQACFSAREFPSQYIYHEADSGDYKIGRTRANVGVEKRLKQHRRKCCKSLRLVGKFFARNHEHAELMIHQELRANGIGSSSRTVDARQNIKR